MKLRLRRSLFALALFLIPMRFAFATEWNTPVTPFKIAGNLYYVGSEEQASYIIATNEGLILINTGPDSAVPFLKKNIESLGFKFKDIHMILISHAHYDHCGGASLVKRMTQARYFVMDADVPAVESGGKRDYQYGSDPSMQFTPTKVDHVVHDGERIIFGGILLKAHITPGHTKGTTTWAFDLVDDGRTLHVVIVGGPYVNSGSKLVNNAAYPKIAEDFKRGFTTLSALPCDLFLGAHGEYYNLDQKLKRFNSGDKNAFIDPDGYKAFIADRQGEFMKQLDAQQKSQ
jgi:metallo-beta-lactamase class B